nr:MAG TPA: putative ATPase [Caudoviricetes sp.]
MKVIVTFSGGKDSLAANYYGLRIGFEFKNYKG